MKTKRLAQLMAVLYLVMVVSVVFHQFGLPTDLLNDPKPLVFIGMGVVSFLVLGKIIDEVTDKPTAGNDDE